MRVAAPGIPLEDGVIDFHTALAAQPDDRLTFGAPGQGDDVAAYFHTGGTTGAPKLVAHTHSSQLAAALGGAALAGMLPGDVLTASLPLFHVGGTIFCGAERASWPASSWSSCRRAACATRPWSAASGTSSSATASRWPARCRLRWVRCWRCRLAMPNIRTIRAGFCGAASLPLAVGERFRQVTGVNLYEVYGMTEASGLICIDPTAGAERRRLGGLRPALHRRCVVRRLDADGSSGEDCAEGEVGVLTVHGPHVSPGYRNPEHNQGVFVDGGCSTRGDLGYLDASGRIHIAGRAKDLIIRSGHNIDPLMIENAMQRHPAVALAAAVGMPDAYAGELPVCYVALRPGATATEAELREHARADDRRAPGLAAAHPSSSMRFR